MESNKNGGFSLVEMIVVVLIMGVIAVALAPQVMKWVDKAKESADFQAKDELLSTAQIALAEYESRAQAPALQDETYNITSAGVTVADGTDNNTGMVALLESYMQGEYPAVKEEDGKVFQIQMQAVGRKILIDTVTGTY